MNSQNCTISTEYSTFAAVNSGFIENVSTVIGPGQYMTVTNILEDEYIFTSTHSIVGVENNDYITVTDSLNSILSQGFSPLTYTFMPGDITGGTIRLHLYIDDICTIQELNLTVTLLNNTVAPTTCQLIENPRVSFRSDTRIDFFWEAPSIGDTPESYNWEVVPAGNAQGVGVVGSGVSNTTNASATGLTNNTSYTFYIRSNCGVNGSSTWLKTTPPILTNSGPPPANDYCSDAISIVEETDKNVSTATAINGTLLNTAGTDIPAEDCSGNSTDNARDDVWYSFLAQTTDINITLEPEFNGILSLFSECNESSLLVCIDSNDASSATKTEEITYNLLVENQTYYFRVYSQGFSASNPNFTIKLWSPTVTTDADGDGYNDVVDCNDGDAAINPGAS
ncbi:MAG: hypothetical protein KAJ28_12075, partial [Flavobacteriaceae bacterium]|nr:hypothetical protein [Flavobacteriaceae bacterium]